ncbi:MAG: PIG-L family deacetylase [Actinomycetota bacterium]|nr:PIG-L family deacetylase [Actinomycetota bacterium]
MSRTIVALHAHPDDESSKGAATIARYHDRGVRTVLVTATGGEAGEILNSEAGAAVADVDLAVVRRSELLDAARIIGYDDVVMLGYRDSGMPGSDDNRHPDAFVNAPLDEVLERLVAIVRAERPHVILGYDDHEWYPHPDHLRIHDLSTAVFEAAADPARFPASGDPWAADRLYAPVFSLRRLRTLSEAMASRGLESPYVGWIERVGPDTVDPPLTVIEVGPYVERARDALRAHRTQIDPNGPWFQIPLDVVHSVYPYEDFELLASRDGADPEGSDLWPPSAAF